MSDDPAHRLAPVVTWRTALVQRSDCSTCKLVGLVLSLYMNERGGSAFPSVATLASDCSTSERTVRKHLNEHLQGVWLRLVERGGQEGQRRQANEWQASTPPELSTGTPAGDAGVGADPGSRFRRPRQQVPPTPAADAAQVVHRTSHRSRGPDGESLFLPGTGWVKGS